MLTKSQVLWFPLFLICLIHVITLVGFFMFPITRQGWMYMFLMYFFSGFGITVGYHRLWSHRTYKASTVWRVFWRLGGAAALQGSIRWWCRLHRLHHSFSDSDIDPYGPNLGFWCSHILWIFHKKDRKEALSKVNISDIEADPVARWQSNNYVWLSLFLAFGMPLILFEDKIQAYFYGGCLARVLVWHTTWFVNSLAHWLGDDEYSNETSAKDHFLTALLTLGEGNHGFHHAFPTSYKNGVKWYQYDPTKWLIELGSLFGLCYELYHPTENEIQKARFQVGEKKLHILGKSIDWPSKPGDFMNFNEVTAAVAAGRKLIIVEDKVCDIEKFQMNHPGGEALIASMIGKEPQVVSKLMHSRHTHTKAARNTMDTLTVALYKE